MKTKHWPVLEFGLDVYGQYLDNTTRIKFRREYMRAICAILHISPRGYGWGGEILCTITNSPTWEARLAAIAVRFYSNVLAQARPLTPDADAEEPTEGSTDNIELGQRALDWLTARPQGELWLECFIMHMQQSDLEVRVHNTRNPPPRVATTVVGRLHDTLTDLGWTSLASSPPPASSVWVGDHVRELLHESGDALNRINILRILPDALASSSHRMVQLCDTLTGNVNSAAPKWSQTYRKRVSKAVYQMHRSRTLIRMLAAVESRSAFNLEPDHDQSMQDSPTAAHMASPDAPSWSNAVIVASDHRQGVLRTWLSLSAASEYTRTALWQAHHVPIQIGDTNDPVPSNDSAAADDRRAVWWNMHVLHAKQRQHPYLDGLRTSRNDLLRRELRNGVAPGQLSHVCPFCGFETPFLVQHWGHGGESVRGCERGFSGLRGRVGRLCSVLHMLGPWG